MLAVALILSTPCLITDDASAESSQLRLYAIMPAGPFEGVAIINNGTSYATLSGYDLYDGEGKVNLGDQLGLYPSESIYLLKSEPAEWFPQCRYVVIGDSGTSGKGFALNDSGDDVYLRYGGQIVDTVVYGSGTAKYGGWSGDTVQKMNKKQMAVRNGTDTDTASDWDIIIPGRTQYGTSSVNASVIPFTFPESGGIPLMDELSSAKNSICISVYLISHPEIAGLLLGSLKNGVDVDILAEGSPAGGMKDAESDVLSTLSSAGADIRLYSTVDSYRRYSYLHSKYAIVDGSSVIITSENWQRSSFTSNRGWGAIIRSAECAQQMTDVFRTDFLSYDTVSFGSLYDVGTVAEYPEYERSDKEYTEYESEVTLCLSPDNSFGSMRSLIDSAEYRIYCEQLTISESWTSEGDNPVSWLCRSEASDIRVLLDGTFDEEGTEGNYIAVEHLCSNGISAKVDDSGVLIHNKGVIVDDAVWLGSVNWTDTSFLDNREAAAIISSAEISSYFSAYFLSDWGEARSFEDEGSISIQFDRTEIKGDHAFIIDAICESVPESAEYSWDTDGDGITDRCGKRIVLTLSEGEHILELFVNYGGMIYHKIFSVEVGEGDTFFSEIDWRYAPFIAICMIIIVWNMIKKKRGDDGSDKRDAHRRR